MIRRSRVWASQLTCLKENVSERRLGGRAAQPITSQQPARRPSSSAPHLRALKRLGNLTSTRTHLDNRPTMFQYALPVDVSAALAALTLELSSRIQPEVHTRRCCRPDAMLSDRSASSISILAGCSAYTMRHLRR